MKRVPPRTNLNSSQLVRSLAGLGVADGADSPQSIAERLGQWLDINDAIALFAALNSSATPWNGAQAGQAASAQASLGDELVRVRTALVHSITAADVALVASKARLSSPLPAPDASVDNPVDFSLFRRHYQTQQRNIAAAIGGLRATAREILSRASPRLRQLAELDAVLDQALSSRERELLATVPLLLEKRFENLRQEHRQAWAEAPAADDPERWMEPGGWLARFCGELRDVLLAELEVRLQPARGLIETYSNEVTQQQ